MEAAVRWSPHSTGERRRFLVVDVSDSSLKLNEVNETGDNNLQYRPVTRYAKLPSFGAFAWSPTQEHLVALGLVSGNASLVRLGEGQRSSETITTFRVKQQRKCNSVAISSQDWLAVALDKTRSDVCLSIYDTNADFNGEPLRRLCAAELVSSVRFFARNPQELVACTQRSYIRIYDLRDGYFGAGGSGSLQASTRHGNNIAIDPLDENCFASGGSTGDPSLTVWDKRWMSNSSSSGSSSGAVLSLSLAGRPTQPTTIHSLRWSGELRGCLAVCSNDGEVRVIDIKNAHGSTLRRDVDYLPVNPWGGAPWHSNRYVSQERTIASPWSSGSHRNKIDSSITAFDWVHGSNSAKTQEMIVLGSDRKARITTISGSNVEADLSAGGDLLVSGHELTITEPSNSQDRPSSPDGTAKAFKDDERDVALVRDLASPEMAMLLSTSTIQRDRCYQGYLFDCRKNAEIVGDDWPLERLWEIVDRFRAQSVDNGMTHASLDLSYTGVAGLWFEKARGSPMSSMADAIAGLTASKDIPAFSGERTDFPEHRQLCLAVCGWQFTGPALEAECQQLVERGLHYQAIVQAVLHDAIPLALNLLRTLIRSRAIPNLGLGALLASDAPLNEAQREMCRWMAADTENSALKALLAFLSTGDWRDVMKTTYLHLGYRVALGLKYLNDTELSGFLEAETARAIRKGDPEGLLLTGLEGKEAMDLLQTYLTRTGDLQTAVLAAAFTQTGADGAGDVRWGMWKEVYFGQMQAWRAFNERTKFTVQHARLVRALQARDASVVAAPAPQAQVMLRCNHCQQSPLGQRRPPPKINGHTSTTSTKTTGPAAQPGTVCQTCGRHMPRCAICMLWLGTPPAPVVGKKEVSSTLEQKMGGMLTLCVRCGHGYHAQHAREWFKRHGGVCAVAECGCLCGLG